MLSTDINIDLQHDAQALRHNLRSAESPEGSFYGHTQAGTSALCQEQTLVF